ncbi:Leucine-rich repeat-containing protein 56, partial [Cichlidogyrus casuarinus]
IPKLENVQITDYPNTFINPTPRKAKNDEMLDEFLSPRRLVCFGEHLPNLKELKLSNSIIPKMRDLGTSLTNITILWMPHCCLHCLYGIATMPNLKELYLAFNELDDVSTLGMLENLETLDLEGKMIRLSLPKVEMLDDVPINEDAEKNFSPEEFKYDWQNIDNLMREVGLVKNESSQKNDNTSENKLDQPRLLAGRIGNQFHVSAHVKRNYQPALVGRNGLVINCPMKMPSKDYSKEQSDEAELVSPHLEADGQTVCGGISSILRRSREEKKKAGMLETFDYGHETKTDDPIKLLEDECKKMLEKTRLWKKEHHMSVQNY